MGIKLKARNNMYVNRISNVLAWVAFASSCVICFVILANTLSEGLDWVFPVQTPEALGYKDNEVKVIDYGNIAASPKLIELNAHVGDFILLAEKRLIRARWEWVPSVIQTLEIKVRFNHFLILLMVSIGGYIVNYIAVGGFRLQPWRKLL